MFWKTAESDFVTLAFKANNFNFDLMKYLRGALRKAWTKINYGDQLDYKQVLIDSPISLDFEKICLSRYEQIVICIIEELEKESSLEEDLQLL